MTVYKAPVKDTLFVLKDVLRATERHSPISPRLFFRRLRSMCWKPNSSEEGSQGLAENVMHPLNQSGDHEGCTRHDDASVTNAQRLQAGPMASIVKAAEKMGLVGALRSFGRPRVCPITVHSAVGRVFSSSANMALMMYPGSDPGRHRRYPLEHGSEEQKHTYVPKDDPRVCGRAP